MARSFKVTVVFDGVDVAEPAPAGETVAARTVRQLAALYEVQPPPVAARNEQRQLGGRLDQPPPVPEPEPEPEQEQEPEPEQEQEQEPEPEQEQEPEEGVAAEPVAALPAVDEGKKIIKLFAIAGFVVGMFLGFHQKKK